MGKKLLKYESVMGGRIQASLILLTLLVVILIGRLGYLQIVNPEKYADAAMQQQVRDKVISASRGAIYDRNGKELAVSVTVYDVLVEVKNVKDSEKEAMIQTFIELCGVNEETLRAEFESDKPRFYASRKVDIATSLELQKYGYSGLSFEESSSRVYPYGKFAGHVLGHLSFDNIGLSGLEQYFEAELKGTDGRMIVMTDASGREISDSAIRYNEPIDGGNLVTTIDEVIQHFTEIALEKALVSTQALNITAIVMDPNTGDILAMSSYPDYDPNNPREPQFQYWTDVIAAEETVEGKGNAISRMWRNPSVNDVYEPGSPFKIVTAAAGIEEGVVTPNEVIVDYGYREVEDRIIKNWTSTPFGPITLTTAVEQSVNTYFMEISHRLGREKLMKYINVFGFGKITGINLPGEAQGILYAENAIGPVELATISFGQGVTATPIQMITAIAAFGNEGVMMRPRIVKEIVDDDGNIIKRYEPETVKTTVSKETAAEVLAMMESVVVNGGGKQAQIEGYRVAGKSGTAQKVINGEYVSGYYISTFTAIAPVEDPQLAIIVIVDEPKGNIFGSTVAAPIVQDIMSDSLRYLGISPNAEVSSVADVQKIEIPEVRNMAYADAITMLNINNLNGEISHQGELSADAVVIDTYPKPGEKVPAGSNIILYFSDDKQVNEVIMPDLRGKTLTEMDMILNELGLVYTVSGTGVIIGQYPAPDTIVEVGSMTSFELQEPQVTVEYGASENAVVSE